VAHLEVCDNIKIPYWLFGAEIARVVGVETAVKGDVALVMVFYRFISIS
jgi:hypothetical protein